VIRNKDGLYDELPPYGYRDSRVKTSAPIKNKVDEMLDILSETYHLDKSEDISRTIKTFLK